MICGSRGSKSRLAKAAGAEPAGQMRDEKLHAVVEAYFQVKMYKTHHGRTAFGSCDVGKVHAVVARSTFPRQNVKKTGIRTTFGGSDVEKCTPLWRGAHFHVKMYKNGRTTLGR